MLVACRTVKITNFLDTQIVKSLTRFIRSALVKTKSVMKYTATGTTQTDEYFVMSLGKIVHKQKYKILFK